MGKTKARHQLTVPTVLRPTADTATKKLLFTDATVTAVMVGGQWHAVRPGSWSVDLRGPYLHAGWRDGAEQHGGQAPRYTAFISQVQMVRHGARAPRARERAKTRAK